MTPADVLVVSLGSTAGLRSSDQELVASLRRAGATTEQAIAAPQDDVRTLVLTDLVWARAARVAAPQAIERHRPRSILYSTITAALLWPTPGAIRFDSLAAVNRQGRHGLWQRPLERRRLREAPLLVAVSNDAARQLPPGAPPAVVVPIPVEPSAADGAEDARDVAVVTYAGDPRKKNLDAILTAWRSVRRAGEELVVAGIAGEQPPDDDGVRFAGRLEPGAFRALLRRARVFAAAPLFEDYGIAQLEALADGCMLVTTPAPGPYVSLAIARELDPRLVGEDIGQALRIALDDPRSDYAAAAARAVEQFTRAATDRVVADELLPRLLG